MAGTAVNTLYEDFEPFCKWQRDQGRDTLEVHLQGFKKDQLKIQLSNLGVIAITGERPLEENKISRFRKEIRLRKDSYKKNEIHARLTGGILCMVLPKKTPLSSSTQDQPTSLPPPKNQEDEKSSNKDRENAVCRLRNLVLNKLQILTSKKNMGRNVAVAVALVMVLGAFLVYKYGHPFQSHVEN
ncbi:uncharacterized protein LOC8282385 [Ricinus communis]|uniref:SHSP domain-containing protein n=1 Tax=Ricinus communis TaxID=3988 RepID=B9SIA0_RICCO|nr:uncharacterized protein LOC8282385 [Ricinus communis]EEF36702.1 conserved hypothetical protein [Ricinus communis]|eukprot:XP_002525719.1 uncharacterized protein LOC8282385 [Ricinus communis]